MGCFMNLLDYVGSCHLWNYFPSVAINQHPPPNIQYSLHLLLFLSSVSHKGALGTREVRAYLLGGHGGDSRVVSSERAAWSASSYPDSLDLDSVWAWKYTLPQPRTQTASRSWRVWSGLMSLSPEVSSPFSMYFESLDGSGYSLCCSLQLPSTRGSLFELGSSWSCKPGCEENCFFVTTLQSWKSPPSSSGNDVAGQHSSHLLGWGKGLALPLVGILEQIIPWNATRWSWLVIIVSG